MLWVLLEAVLITRIKHTIYCRNIVIYKLRGVCEDMCILQNSSIAVKSIAKHRDSLYVDDYLRVTTAVAGDSIEMHQKADEPKWATLSLP